MDLRPLPHPLGWRAALRALALLGCSADLGAAYSNELRVGTARIYGDEDYYTRLKAISPSHGVLRPPFKPEHSSYELVLEEPWVKEAVFTILLDISRYNLMYTPQLTFDNGEANEVFAYSPLDMIKFVVPVNGSIGAYDKTVHVKVADPESGGAFGLGQNVFTYSIHIVQPPEYKEVCLATKLALKDGNGSLVPSEPAFDPDLRSELRETRERYNFVLRGEQTKYLLDFECPQVPGVSKYVDGKRLWPKQEQIVDVSKDFHVRMVATCEYHDDTWESDGRQRWASETRTFELHFRRIFASAALDQMLMQVMLLPSFGYCQRRPEDAARRLADGDQEAQTHLGFLCRASASTAQFMVLFNNTRPRASLVSENGLRVHRLTSGIPALVGLDGDRASYTLSISDGVHTEVKYPIDFIIPQRCSLLQCPDGLVHRESLSEFKVEDQMCLDTTCTLEADEDHCCAKPAFCSALAECKKHMTPRPNAKDVNCAGNICHTEVDAAACCETKMATCDSYGQTCPKHTVLRSDAKGYPCQDYRCTQEADEAACCVDEASSDAVGQRKRVGEGPVRFPLETGDQVILRSSSSQGEERGTLVKRANYDAGQWVIKKEDATEDTVRLHVGDIVISDGQMGVVSAEEGADHNVLVTFVLKQPKAGQHVWIFMPGDEVVAPEHDGSGKETGVLRASDRASGGAGTWMVDMEDGTTKSIKLEAGMEVIAHGMRGTIVSGPGEDGGIAVDFREESAQEESTVHKGDHVIVYGTPGVVKTGPDVHGLYRVIYADGQLSYPLPQFVLQEPPPPLKEPTNLTKAGPRDKFQPGDQVTVSGHFGFGIVVLGPLLDGKTKMYLVNFKQDSSAHRASEERIHLMWRSPDLENLMTADAADGGAVVPPGLVGAWSLPVACLAVGGIAMLAIGLRDNACPAIQISRVDQRSIRQWPRESEVSELLTFDA